MNLTPLEITFLAILAIILIYVLTRIIFTGVFISWWKVKDWWFKQTKKEKEENKDASKTTRP